MKTVPLQMSELQGGNFGWNLWIRWTKSPYQQSSTQRELWPRVSNSQLKLKSKTLNTGISVGCSQSAEKASEYLASLNPTLLTFLGIIK